MRVVILGGSGFIGTALTSHLTSRGDDVVIPRDTLQRFPLLTIGNSGLGTDETPKGSRKFLKARTASSIFWGKHRGGQMEPGTKTRIVQSRLMREARWSPP